MRLWRVIVDRLRRAKGEDMNAAARHVARPRRLPPEVRQLPGKWVAIKDGEVIAAHEKPDRVYEELHRKGIRDASILRSPSEQDTELIGMG